MANMNIKGDEPQMPEYDPSPTIYLNDDQVEALGISGIPQPGTTLALTVKAVVLSVTASQEESDETAKEGTAPDVRLTLRCADITVADSGKSIADTLYSE